MGKDAVPVNGIHYQFSYESWVRARHNAFMYGRCIKVLDPTTKLRNHWVGVLPQSIARRERPTTGGQDYVDKATKNGVARLWYGNSDDSFEATYLRHVEELNGTTPEVRETNFRERISSAIQSAGSFVLESIYSFSAPLVADDDESVADIDLLFRSSFDGKTLTYTLSYSKKSLSPKYAETALSVQFNGEGISRLEKLADSPWSLSSGEGKLFFEASTTLEAQADFVAHQMTLLDQKGRSVATVPISYMLPAEK